ncbi:hypothetical protein LX36DRAFT_742625 [Colletotrichum falcatum]|nr:hypothetical protein LX36DRAFT_742625 [Colletotrichum falcatum]
MLDMPHILPIHGYVGYVNYPTYPPLSSSLSYHHMTCSIVLPFRRSHPSALSRWSSCSLQDAAPPALPGLWWG